MDGNIEIEIRNVGAARAEPQPEAAANRAQTAQAVPKDLEIIKALITDIRDGAVTVRLASGAELTAALTGDLGARIGDAAKFTVRYLLNGSISLEPMPVELPPRAALMSDALMQAGFVATDENLKLVSLLLGGGFAINGDTLKQLNQAVRLFNGDEEKAVFLMRNSSVTPENAAVLDGLMTGGAKVSIMIENIIDGILRINDPAVRNGVAEAMLADAPNNDAPARPAAPVVVAAEPAIRPGTAVGAEVLIAAETLAIEAEENETIPGQAARPVVREGIKPAADTDAVKLPAAATQITDEDTETDAAVKIRAEVERPTAAVRQNFKDSMVKKFFIDLRSLNAEEFTKKTASLAEGLERAGKRLPPSEIKLHSELKNLGDNLRFISQLKDLIYVQIPLVVNERKTACELYVFKHGGRAKRADGSVCALVCLDTANLGRVEAYIVKDNRSVLCQFRVPEGEDGEPFRSNVRLLADGLMRYGYTLGGCTFIERTEAFGLISNEPGADAKPAPEGKYMFDVRT